MNRPLQPTLRIEVLADEIDHLEKLGMPAVVIDVLRDKLAKEVDAEFERLACMAG